MASDLALSRCPWADPRNPVLVAYHDEEWGVPLRDDRALFELLSLEGFQAGLSWSTILAKRQGFREAFDNFEAAVVASYDADRVRALATNVAIVRNRAKIEATVRNASALLGVAREFGSFAAYVWRFVGGVPRVNRPSALADVPSSSPESDALSRDLRERGFRFVGTTTAYAFMQATGLVDDHLAGCFRARPASVERL